MFRQFVCANVFVFAVAGYSLQAQDETKTKKKADPAPAAAPAEAGKFKQDKPAESYLDKRNEGALRAQVFKMLRGELAMSGADADIFDNYYNLYKFPLLTFSDSESLRKLPEERAKFFREHFLEDGRGIQPVHNRLADLTLDYMLKVANENYHPAVRFNAMTIIGMLNDQELVRSGAAKVNPEPFTRALQPMVTAFEAADQLDLVRLAALTGIVRHVEGDNFRAPNDRIAESLRNDVIALLTKLAKQKQGPADRTPGGHLWMRSKAVEGLGHSQFNKANPATIDVLDALIADDKDALNIRVAAAHALGRVNWASGVKYDIAAGLERMDDLLADIVTAEKTRFDVAKKREEEAVGPVSASAAGGVGGSYTPVREMSNPYQTNTLSIPVDPYAYRIEASRRRLRAWVNSIELAIKGIDFRGRPAPAVTSNEQRGLASLAKNPPDVKALDALQKELDRLIKKIENETAEVQDRETYTQELQAALDQLGKSAKPAAAPAKQENAAEPKAAPASVDDPLE